VPDLVATGNGPGNSRTLDNCLLEPAAGAHEPAYVMARISASAPGLEPMCRACAEAYDDAGLLAYAVRRFAR
jgi:hypothetical protein